MNHLTIRAEKLAALLLAAPCAFALTGCATSGQKDPVVVDPCLTIENAGDHFRSIVYSSDGSRVLVGQGPRPRIWDVRTGREGANFEAFEAYEAAGWTQEPHNRPALFSPDDKWVAAASFGEVFLLDADSGKLRAKFEVSRSPEQSLAFSSDGSRLLWAGELGRGPFGLSAAVVEARAWNLATNELEWTERVRDAESPCLSPNGSFLAFYRRTSLFHHDEVHIWDVATRGQTGVMEDRAWRHRYARLKVSRDGSHLAVSESGGTFIRTTANGSCFALRESIFGTAQEPFAFSPEGRFVAEGSNEGVALSDAHTGKVLAYLRYPHSLTWYGISSPDELAFSPDGRFLAATATDHRIRIWDVPQLIENSDGAQPGTSSSEVSKGGR